MIFSASLMQILTVQTRLFMTKKTIFLCHLRLAKTHVHPCLDHFLKIFHFHLVEETVSLVDLPILGATVSTVSKVSAEVNFRIDNSNVFNFVPMETKRQPHTI